MKLALVMFLCAVGGARGEYGLLSEHVLDTVTGKSVEIPSSKVCGDYFALIEGKTLTLLRYYPVLLVGDKLESREFRAPQEKIEVVIDNRKAIPTAQLTAGPVGKAKLLIRISQKELKKARGCLPVPAELPVDPKTVI